MNALLRELLEVAFATVWQGTLVAILTGAFLRVAGTRLNAATRTAILQAALAAIVVIAALTRLSAARAADVRIGGYATQDKAAAARTTGGLSSAASRRIDVALSDRTVDILAVFWTGGALWFAGRIVAGHLQTARLIRKSERQDDRNGARLFVSDEVAIPFTAGFRRPAIVIPRALADDAGESFEAILLHELAHVRRRDVFAGALERVPGALLFFNPAIHYIVRAISLERESACDDWAVTRCRDLDTYARALATFALGRHTVAYGAALGFGHATISRLRRLEDIRRNGATTLAPSVLRGSMLSLASVAIALHAFAPAVAFTPKSAPVHVAIGSPSCDREAKYLTGPYPAGLPNGNYDARILVSVSANARITGMTIRKSSGNTTFDRDVEKIVAKSRFAPPMRGCKAVAGSYVFVIRTTKA